MCVSSALKYPIPPPNNKTKVRTVPTDVSTNIGTNLQSTQPSREHTGPGQGVSGLPPHSHMPRAAGTGTRPNMAHDVSLLAGMMAPLPFTRPHMGPCWGRGKGDQDQSSIHHTNPACQLLSHKARCMADCGQLPILAPGLRQMGRAVWGWWLLYAASPLICIICKANTGERKLPGGNSPGGQGLTPLDIARVTW